VSERHGVGSGGSVGSGAGAGAPPIEPAERADRARAAFARLGADVGALVLFDDQYIQYFADFVFHPTERPIALVLTREGERTLFVPRLELEHAREVADVEHVVSYGEYPGERDPVEQLVEYLREGALDRGPLGVDHDGYPPVMGYAPRPLSGWVAVRAVSPTIDAQMAVKSQAEVALIRASAHWGARAHELLQAYTAVGKRENEVSGRATREATEAMGRALGEGYRPRNRWIQGAVALYRGQIGPNSALPHAVTLDAEFRAGDTLVTGAGADVWGYISELERTMVLGEPSAEQRRYFGHMLALQDLAFDAIGPGVAAADVDRAVRAYVADHGLDACWRHHVGHSLGQRIHESPFLDVGDSRMLEPGMVLSVEPGLYVPGLGGFRHSDTVLVTEDGIELLTGYPRDLVSLTLPA
jgi:Xaa-Pro aminopeptidase